MLTVRQGRIVNVCERKRALTATVALLGMVPLISACAFEPQIYEIDPHCFADDAEEIYEELYFDPKAEPPPPLECPEPPVVVGPDTLGTGVQPSNDPPDEPSEEPPEENDPVEFARPGYNDGSVERFDNLPSTGNSYEGVNEPAAEQLTGNNYTRFGR